MEIPVGGTEKFNRAQVHFAGLKNEVTEFFGSHPYTIRRDSSPDLKVHRFYADFIKDVPLLHWGLILGDGIHNLRCALDQAVYAVAIAESGMDPPPDHKKLQFPITSDSKGWEAEKGRIASLSKSAQNAIERQQPRNYGADFLLTPLGGVREFDNNDKHHVVRIVASFVRTAELLVAGLPPGAECQMTWHVGPIARERPILTLTTGRSAPDVDMNKGLDIDLGLPHTRPNGREATIPLWEAVDQMNTSVRAALTDLAQSCSSQPIKARSE
jgi:hypothetical protein